MYLGNSPRTTRLQCLDDTRLGLWLGLGLAFRLRVRVQVMSKHWGLIVRGELSDIPAKALDFCGTDCGLSRGHKVPQIIDPRLRNFVSNLVCIKPNVQPPTTRRSLNFGNVDAGFLTN